MCQQFRFDYKSQFRVFLAKPQKAADLKLPHRGSNAQVSLGRELNHDASRAESDL